MPTETIDAVLAGAVALIVTVLLVPPAAALAHRLGAIDRPKERGLHDTPMPRLGGLAMLAGVMLASLLWLPGGEETHGILLGALAITAIGLADDVFDLHPGLKLAGQIAAALIPVVSEVRVDSFTAPFIGVVDLGWLGYPATVVGIVAIVNIVNFIDGVDGLASGVGAIAAMAFAVIALSLDRAEAGILAAITAGAALGFLRHGFPPASSFMGDTGSHLLGFLLATAAIQGALKTNAVVALAFPLLILAVPILDSSFVIAKRIKHRRPIYSADRWHLHHRLANIGFSARRTLLYLYVWAMSLAGLAIALRFVPYSDDRGQLDALWATAMGGLGLLVLAASLYVIETLEILKLRRMRARQISLLRSLRGAPQPDSRELDEGVAHELETGEFTVPDAGSDEVEALDPRA